MTQARYSNKKFMLRITTGSCEGPTLVGCHRVKQPPLKKIFLVKSDNRGLNRLVHNLMIF